MVLFMGQRNYHGNLHAPQHACLTHSCLCLHMQVEHFTRGHMCPPVSFSSYLDIVQFLELIIVHVLQ